MTLGKKHMQQLKSRMKRRELRPASTYQPPATLKITPRERDRITQTNPGLLLSIESLIVTTWNEIPELNDHHVEQALISVIQQTPLSSAGPAQTLAQSLHEKGKLFHEGDSPNANSPNANSPNYTPNEDWLMALRAILSSVQTRMSQPGTRHYLTYAEKFVSQVKRAPRPNF